MCDIHVCTMLLCHADVCIDIVGKYSYHLYAPHEDRRAPVLVDVVLVGRTKIIKIHSALYVHNATSQKLGFRLQMPSPPMARQVRA